MVGVFQRFHSCAWKVRGGPWCHPCQWHLRRADPQPRAKKPCPSLLLMLGRWYFSAHKPPKILYWILPSCRSGKRILGSLWNGRTPGALADQASQLYFLFSITPVLSAMLLLQDHISWGHACHACHGEITLKVLCQKSHSGLFQFAS